MARGGYRAGAGRKKGVPNKATADVKALAQKYTTPVLAELARLALHAESEAARVAAGKELLDRGHGRPSQAIDVTATVKRPQEMTDAELLAIASGARAAGQTESEEQPSSVH